MFLRFAERRSLTLPQHAIAYFEVFCKAMSTTCYAYAFGKDNVLTWEEIKASIKGHRICYTEIDRQVAGSIKILTIAPPPLNQADQ